MIASPAKASQVIDRARSLSDLPQAKFISHSDELDSLNDSWRDKYQRLIDSTDDYYVTNVTLTITNATLVAGTAYEFLIPLPSDFYKLRFLDYNSGPSQWVPMKKFPLSMKDYNTGEPYYRLQGANLWVIWGGYNLANTSIKIGYYPPPVSVTCPQKPLEYGTSYTRDLFAGVTAPCYAPAAQTMVYVYGATFIIKAESVSNITVTSPVSLFTESAAVTNIVYYKGTLYWIRGGLIWYKPTGLAAAFTAPNQATTPSGVICFYIASNTIYYTTATQIRSCDLTGGTDALVNATANVTSVVVIGPTVIYRTTASIVGTLVPTTTMYASGIAKVTGDGGSSNQFFLLDNAGNTRRVTFNVTTAAIVTDDIVDTHAADIGQVSYDIGQTPNTWIIPTLKTENNYQQLLGVDGSVDYTFTYPNNIVPEIMAYQSAIDYRSKRQEDPTLLVARLGNPSSPPNEPATGLWERFERVLRRDDYSAETIRNDYDFGWNR
jgi:hypothetical protein